MRKTLTVIGLGAILATPSCYLSIGFDEDGFVESADTTFDGDQVLADSDSDYVRPDSSDSETESEASNTGDPSETDSSEVVVHPTPVEPATDTEVAIVDTATAGGEETDMETDLPEPIPGGVDILLVVDNSLSMEEEKRLFSMAVFTLINELLSPRDGRDGVESVRVGVSTSDMGLQVGWQREVTDLAYVDGCDGAGDDGALRELPDYATTMRIESGQVACTNAEKHCPDGYTCEAGFCSAANGGDEIQCPVGSPNPYVETTDAASLNDFPIHAACAIAQVETNGCGIEQQLSGAVRALEVNPAFLVPEHHLQVIVLTDEDDCSVKDEGLFETDEWRYKVNGFSLANIACAYPAENDNYLFTPNEIRDFFYKAKKGEREKVYFAAIAGVPDADECQGFDGEVEACFNHPDMSVRLEYPPGEAFALFGVACTRMENGQVVTNAVPGWRFVRTADAFGENGAVFSICRSDWTPIMDAIAKRIWEGVSATNL